MADLKLTDLTAITQANVDNNVLLYVVDVTGGTVDRKVTRQNLYLAVANTWTKGQTFTPDTATALAVTPPTGPTGSASPFFAGLSIATATVAFATSAQSGDFDTVFIGQSTLTNPSSGTITNASSVKIIGAPIASTNVTITNPYALWVAGGISRFDEQVTYTSALNTPLKITPASAPVGSSSEFVAGANYVAATVAFATSAQTGDYVGSKFGQATITGPSAGTVTNASTLKIMGAPIASTNVTITNAYSLWVAAGSTLLQATTIAGTLTMSSANISIGQNKIITTDQQMWDFSSAVGMVIQATANHGTGVLTIVPNNPTSGTSSALQFFGTDYTIDQTNFEYLALIATYQSSYNFGAAKGGSGSLRPLNLVAGLTQALQVTTVADIVIGPGSAISTSATAGFLIIPSCAGAPTGTPTNAGSGIPMVYDTTDHRLYIYEGGAWHYIARTA